jgi:hypothetical protein
VGINAQSSEITAVKYGDVFDEFKAYIAKSAIISLMQRNYIILCDAISVAKNIQERKQG